jgi:hypothetical protein
MQRYIKATTKSAKFELRLKSYNGKVFGISLYSKKRNAVIREVTIFDLAYLYQYNLTVGQMLFLENIEVMLKIYGKVPDSITEISNFHKTIKTATTLKETA